MATQQEILIFKELTKKGLSPDKAKEIIIRGRNENTINVISENLKIRVPKTELQQDISQEGFRLATDKEKQLFTSPVESEDIKEVSGVQPVGKEEISQKQGIKGFLKETGEALSNRAGNIGESIGRLQERSKEDTIAKAIKEKGNLAGFLESMKQSALDLGTATQVVGQVIAGGLDTAWEGVENLVQTVTPEKAEKIIEGAVQKIGDTKIVQDIAKSYMDFREKNPESARNIEAVANIAQVLPITKTGRAITGTAVKETIKAPVIIPAKTTAAIIRKATPESISKTIAGIDDIAANEIKNVSKSELKGVLNTAQKAVEDIRNPSPFEKAGDIAKEALDTLKVQKNIAAKTKADALKSVANETISTKELKDKFLTLINDRYSLEVGDKGKLVPIAGKVSRISDADISDLQKFYSNFKVVESSGKITLENLDSLVDKLQSSLKRGALDRPGAVATSVEKTLNGFIEGDINALLKKTAGKTFEKANEVFKNKLDTFSELEKLLGAEGTKAGSLFKSLFSPQTGARARNLFKSIYEETGIDLNKEAVLAKFAMEAVGDTRGLNLLESVISGGNTSIINPGLIQKALQTVYKPAKIAESMTKQVGIKDKISNISKKVVTNDVYNNIGQLTINNIKQVSQKISKSLGVPVEKVQTLLRGYLSKYGTDIKDKIGEIMDDLADKLGVRHKLMSGEGTGISGKVTKTLDDMTDEQFLKLVEEISGPQRNRYGYKAFLERKSGKTEADKKILERLKKIEVEEEKLGKVKLDKDVIEFDTKVKDIINKSNSFDEFVGAFSDGVDFNVYKKYLIDNNVPVGGDMKFFKELYDNIKANKGTGISGKIESIRYDQIVDDIKTNGGITLNVGDSKNLGGQSYIAVSPYPNRSKILKSEDFDYNILEEYIIDNADKLLEKGHTLGAWIDDGGDVYLDVTLAIPKKHTAQAIKLGEKYNQKAVFDLETFEEIPTKGTGKSIKINESDVLNDIKDLLD